MSKYFQIEPETIPDGYELRKTKCRKCYGAGRYSGVYGSTACECNKGVAWLLFRVYKKKELEVQDETQTS